MESNGDAYDLYSSENIDAQHCEKHGFDIRQLKQLFQDQQQLLDHFFKNLNYKEVQAFTQLCADTKGVIFFSGVGKSGFVAQKCAQTLVSTGTKAVFLSPTDALHGDIGLVGPNDVLVLFSKSGATEELNKLIPCARAKSAYLVGISSLKHSNFRKMCDMHVYLPLERELCPFDLAPVTSTAIQMLFCDTVAIALMKAKNLTREQYALNHPAGRIGRRLSFRVEDIMRKGDSLPLCRESDLIMDQLVELTVKGYGCLIVIDASNRLLGTFTDGDLRRALNSSRENIFHLQVGEMCNREPRWIEENVMAIAAMKKMEEGASAVTFLPVLDYNKVVIGLITLHDLVSAGL
ncbi:probable arabinose 5-phosphate isomerase [Physcomitrium patens]|uniref:Uncharacterized protein n=1 Tax=Physcomitrium patens TaxID=3218 RepID=A9T5Q5_PHYPA|nr:probable arabinose 5-phosphate isomerase [Physcomitrium patens]PNR54005.1 hypothetical protein PHYPA_007681 [Physcomitrium patens]|eukprot:XP_024375343.1 probable arabinose 5-phosphate isomerase [Physcomitrella patens]